MNKTLMILALACLVACGGDDTDTNDTEETTTDTSETVDPDDLVVNKTQFGVPTWSVVGAELFVAPMTADTAKCLLEPKHRFDGLVWLPNTAHPEPFTGEFADAVDSCGFEAKNAFSEEEFSAPNGVFLGLLAVGSAAGSTPDYDEGTFIPSEKFPMVVDGDVRRDLVIVDSDQDRSYPDPIGLGYNVDGHSHVPLLFQMNLERMPAGATPPGNYTFRLAIRDATSQVDPTGWDIEVPFTVE